MKKIFTMIALATGISFAATAQNWERRNDRDIYQADRSIDQRGRGDRRQQEDYSYDRNRRFDDNRRQQEYHRMNRDYDRRIDQYRRDRRMSRYERDRQIQQAEYERQQRNRSFGTGLVVGGIAAIVLGAIISNH
jgi:hypothetical protein